MRHGTSEGNVSVEDVPDPLLTGEGRREAGSWQGRLADYEAELVLVSPLRRTVQTACLAFAKDDVPMLLCRHARELSLDTLENIIQSSPEDLRGLLKRLPRGEFMQGIEAALIASSDDPQDDDESIARLRGIIAARPERVLAVVCHYNVIMELCGVDCDNGDLVRCLLGPDKQFEVLEHRRAPCTECSWWCLC